MLSLAVADVLHGIVTTSFFYPPIILKNIPISSIGVRIFNIIDWTAWSITLTLVFLNLIYMFQPELYLSHNGNF